jgi:microcystin-dependent protein
MAVNLSPIGNGQQFFDNTGLPLNGGLIYTYQAGSSTPLATYTDVSGSIANSNPIVLDSSGRLTNEIWLTYGYFYKFVVKNSAGSTLGTYDNIYGIVGVQTAVGTTIPAGMISLWYGSIGSVPTGWYLCDGTNGTPDLRDRFIVGAGTSYAVGATGGSANHTLTTAEMPTHTHTATVTDPGHTHVYGPGSVSASSFAYGAGGGNPGVNIPTSSTGTTNSNTTGITTSIASAGSSTAFSILNPYYALAYVMKS